MSVVWLLTQRTHFFFYGNFRTQKLGYAKFHVYVDLNWLLTRKQTHYSMDKYKTPVSTTKKPLDYR